MDDMVTITEEAPEPQPAGQIKKPVLLEPETEVGPPDSPSRTQQARHPGSPALKHAGLI
jgi:hypothetical protein